MEQYEDDENTRRRVLSNGQVLAFILSYWRRRPALIASVFALCSTLRHLTHFCLPRK